MAVFTLGQAAYVNKGTYNSGTAYSALNTVFYNGGTWVALKNVTNVTPGSDATKWLCITQGIKQVAIAQSGGNAEITITLTDGTTATATVPLATVGDGTITVQKLASGFVLPVNQGGTGATSASAARTNLGAQAAINVVTNMSLTVPGWNSNTKKQAVSITGMTASSHVIAAPNTKAGYIAAMDATIYPPVPGSGKLTFECDTIPGAEIPLDIYWW